MGAGPRRPEGNSHGTHRRTPLAHAAPNRLPNPRLSLPSLPAPAPCAQNQVFNILCEHPETVAAFLVPRARSVVARGASSTAIRYLTPLRCAAAHVLAGKGQLAALKSGYTSLLTLPPCHTPLTAQDHRQVPGGPAALPPLL